MRRMKRSWLSVAEDSDEEPTTQELVTQEGNCVFFYDEVSRSSVLKLVQCLTKANEHALRNCTSVYEATVYLYIHSSGGDACSRASSSRNSASCCSSETTSSAAASAGVRRPLALAAR